MNRLERNVAVITGAGSGIRALVTHRFPPERVPEAPEHAPGAEKGLILVGGGA